MRALIPLLLLLVTTTTGCATAAEMRKLADGYALVEARLLDQESSTEDVREAVGGLIDDLHEVADNVEARGEELGGLLSLEEGGLMSLGSGLLVYLIRELTRKKALKKVEAKSGSGTLLV